MHAYLVCCIQTATVQQLPSTELCLCGQPGLVTAQPPVNEALCSVDGVIGPSLLGRQDSKLFGIELPIIPCLGLSIISLNQREHGT